MPGVVHNIPILTTFVAIAFAPIVFRRWQRRKPAPHLWWWALGIALYGVGTLTESLTTLFGWNETVFRSWYVAGALLGGAPLAHGVDASGLFSLEFGQADDAIGAVEVAGQVIDPATVGLERVAIEDEAGSSGYHVPEGSLFVYDPRHPATDRSRARVSTTAIAPAILAVLGIDPPDHHEPDSAFSLTP